MRTVRIECYVRSDAKNATRRDETTTEHECGDYSMDENEIKCTQKGETKRNAAMQQNELNGELGLRTRTYERKRQ